MKEIITAKGVLKYRDPNCLEVYDMLEASGIYSGESSTNRLKRNITAVMGDMIDSSGIEGNPSYEELLNDVENMMIPLSEISDEIILKAFSAFKKKAQSETQS